MALFAAAPSWAAAQSPQPIVLGATAAQRREAARALVPLLKDVKAHARPGPTVAPGSAPNSPFTGTQTTLDGTWGGAGKDRADLRDELLLETLKVAALQP